MRHTLVKILFISIIIFSFHSTKAQQLAVWATAWSVNTPEKIDHMLTTLHRHGFNRLFFQARYRADALYFPNKNDSTYPNPDSLCYLLRDSLFDPLQYALNKASDYNIRIYAWVTTFVVTPHDLRKITPSHIFYRHPEWLLKDTAGQAIRYYEYEGAFIDPALPTARQYTLNVLADIAQNYPQLAGIQLDYVRYPDSIYGWNALSRKLKDSLPSFHFNQWRKQQISSFVNQAYIILKNINPSLEISVAVIADSLKRSNAYAQDWPQWLNEGYIDRLYIMAYNTSNRSFSTRIKELSLLPRRNKITIIIRAWQGQRYYHYSKINDKLKILRQYHFHDIGFYNYSGLINNHYIHHLKF